MKRYCTIEESLIKSLKQMRTIRNSRIRAKTWDEFKKEFQKK